MEKKKNLKNLVASKVDLYKFQHNWLLEKGEIEWNIIRLYTKVLANMVLKWNLKTLTKSISLKRINKEFEKKKKSLNFFFFVLFWRRALAIFWSLDRKMRAKRRMWPWEISNLCGRTWDISACLVKRFWAKIRYYKF